MKVYQQLQLNQAGSKNLISGASGSRQRLEYISVYIFKVLLTVAFCFVFVSVFSILFGKENSIVGVVTLLSVLVLRQADLGIDARHGVPVLWGIFLIFAAGPHISNLLSPAGAFAVNLACIFAIVFLSCHNVIMSNHLTFVLNYLLLQGYDVSGDAFSLRLWALAFGAAAASLVFYRNHRSRDFDAGFFDLFKSFDFSSARTQWQIRFSLGICLTLLIARIAGLDRAMWAGIAAMSVLSPQPADLAARTKWRAPGNVLGCLIFAALSFILPDKIFLYIGIIGGICIGFSASYKWQTIFNTFGALSIASGIFGMPAAIALRIIHNTLGSLFGFLFDRIFRAAVSRIAPKPADG